MKHIVSLALAAILAICSVIRSEACTNLIVGKLASVDGSVICTYNCDGFGFAASLSYSAPGKHAPGEMIALRGWGPGSTVHYIPQAEYTYSVAGLMNEKQVSIVETTWDGRKELRNPEGYLDYFTLMNLALQRSATAREAIAVMQSSGTRRATQMPPFRPGPFPISSIIQASSLSQTANDSPVLL